MNYIVGMDPGSEHTGLVQLRDGVLDDWANVAMLGSDRLRGFRERIIPVLERWERVPRATLVVEAPPPAYHSEAHHGPQAPIGDALGFLGGLAMGWWMARTNYVVDRVPPGSDKIPGWRQTMCIEAARRGINLWAVPKSEAKPGSLRPTRERIRRNPLGGFLVPYAGCSHTVSCRNLEAVQESPARCPTCERETSVKAEETSRDRWKRAACLFVNTVWPLQYEAIVTDARSRADSVRESHAYAGVSDVCEAACLALHVQVTRGAS